MYERYFNLDREPFSIAPDPNFLYLSDSHSEALAHLMYGFSHGGFVLITGEVGTGKTTLLRNLIKHTPADLDVAFILNPRLTVRELLETICEELGILSTSPQALSVKGYIDRLNRHLLKTHQAGRSTVVIIDEAQNLSPAVLEQIRLLTNLETDERKLIRIILLGQPELGEMLDRPQLRQLAQRITARYHLQKLNRQECAEYVAHRLGRAGGDPSLFEPAAIRRLHSLSKGIPRLINIVADRALLGTYATNATRVTADLVDRAAQEVMPTRKSYRLWVSVGVVCVTLVAMIWTWIALSPDPLLADSADPAPPKPARVERPVRTEVPSEVKDAQPERDPPAQEPPPLEVASVDTPPSALEPLHLTRPEGPSYLLLRRAFAKLFDLWNVEYDPEVKSIPCDVAPSVDLQCLLQRGSWDDMLSFNMPVILELWTEEPTPFYAVLSAYRDNRLTLNLEGREIHTTPAQLRDTWVGRYIVLWRMPPNYQGSLARGENKESVAWLREQLQQVMNLDLSSETPVRFDTDLYDAVVAFQQSEQLLPDGVVGPATWIRLNQRLGLPQPSLN
jgi:general secretion pathway protein A